VGCLVVFVTKIDILATQSSKINYDLCSIENNNAFSVKYSNVLCGSGVFSVNFTWPQNKFLDSHPPVNKNMRKEGGIYS
jgi:hypothetical protein